VNERREIKVPSVTSFPSDHRVDRIRAAFVRDVAQAHSGAQVEKLGREMRRRAHGQRAIGERFLLRERDELLHRVRRQ
jgi:hypothetical protein